MKCQASISEKLTGKVRHLSFSRDLMVAAEYTGRWIKVPPTEPGAWKAAVYGLQG